MKTSSLFRLDSNLTSMRRFHIIGGPGSGKSTLAEELAARTGAPVYHLDHIAFEGPFFDERPAAGRRADVHVIAGKPCWITEGIFVGWTDELLQAADVIIWLDHIRWYTAAWRLGTRFLHGAIAEVGRQRGVRKFNRFRDYATRLHQLAADLRAVRGQYAGRPPNADTADRDGSRATAARHLAPYSSKVIHCHSQADLRELLRQIDSQRAPAGGA